MCWLRQCSSMHASRCVFSVLMVFEQACGRGSVLVWPQTSKSGTSDVWCVAVSAFAVAACGRLRLAMPSMHTWPVPRHGSLNLGALLVLVLFHSGLGCCSYLLEQRGRSSRGLVCAQHTSALLPSWHSVSATVLCCAETCCWKEYVQMQCDLHPGQCRVPAPVMVAAVSCSCGPAGGKQACMLHTDVLRYGTVLPCI
jgi:hypothetical protein